jgi:amino acid transporter
MTEKITLRTGAVGLIGAATLGTVMLSPALTLYANFGAAYVQAGSAAPLAFIWALLATIPTATSYALLSRSYPESGSAASWTARALSADAGRWLGWMVFLYYFTNFILQPITFGLFFNDLLAGLGVAHSGLGCFAAGAFLCCAIPALIVYRGITPSMQGALLFLCFEALVVVALCAAVSLLNPSAHLSAAGFRMPSSAEAAGGVWRALIFAMLSYCGFDVISTIAEETQLPRKLVPQATFLSLLCFGAVIVAGTWCLTYADSPERLKALADGSGMPITEIARQFWGRGSLLVVGTGISAALGIAIATAVGASRILYSMGRSGLGSPSFAKLHPRYQVPWNAMHAVFGVGLFAAAVTGFAIGPYASYLWWGTATTFFAMVTFLFVNVANLLLHRDRILDSTVSFVLYGALPVAGIGADGFILVKSFFLELWPQSWASGKSVVLFDVACALIAGVTILVARSGSSRTVALEVENA